MNPEIVLAVLVKESLLRKLAINPRARAIGVAHARFKRMGHSPEWAKKLTHESIPAIEAHVQKTPGLYRKGGPAVRDLQTFNQRARESSEYSEGTLKQIRDAGPGTAKPDSGGVGIVPVAAGIGLTGLAGAAALKLRSMWKARKALKAAKAVASA